MKVTIIGTGYVGLVTGTCFADIGNDVTCVDIDSTKIAGLKRGVLPIYEPGLEALCGKNYKAGRLHFTTELSQAVPQADIIFLALPTPSDEDGSADLSYVLGVAEKLGPLLRGYTVVVNKSTVPVGTAEEVSAKIAQHAKVPFDVISNPEFLREGFAISDFIQPDRIVVGSQSAKAQELISQLYEPLTRQGCPLYVMNQRSAELTKYAANAFLATKITFMNQIADVCERVGADVEQVRQAIGSDPRIGSRNLQAGIGYGGSCFPKDLSALIKTSQENDYDFSTLRAVVAHNKLRPLQMADKLVAYFGGAKRLKGKKIAVWGLAFKSDTDDIREAPALPIIQSLLSRGATVVAYDPEAMDNTRQVFKGQPAISFAKDALGALRGADALLLATEWPEFASVPLTSIKKALAHPVVFDGRNMFDPAAMHKHGFYYQSIGRAVVKPKSPKS